MRTIRSFVDRPLGTGDTFPLPEATGNHLVRVLRLEVGDTCVLFNGDGHDYMARLLSREKRGAVVEIVGHHAVGNESPLRITLIQCIARGEKMDLILQKGTELGVAAFAPASTDRTEVRLDAERSEKKMAHWRGVLASACEQSGRARLPDLAAPRALADAVAADANALRFLLDPEASDAIVDLALPRDAALTLAIGPEGGFSDRDRAILKAGGFRGLRLGPRILRTETAGLAAIAALMAIYGDWR
jgi:16S rRNA (uracil1498-N3)-methyltransferase